MPTNPPESTKQPSITTVQSAERLFRLNKSLIKIYSFQLKSDNFREYKVLEPAQQSRLIKNERTKPTATWGAQNPVNKNCVFFQRRQFLLLNHP